MLRLDAPDSKRFAYYGIDDVEAGREVMRQLAEAMGGTGVVAILAGNQAPNLQARVRGVVEEAENFPDISIGYTFYHPETAADAANKVQQEQQANPDITGWAMVGGWPLFTTNAAGRRARGGQGRLGRSPRRGAAVRPRRAGAGGTIGQDCYGWGYETVMMLFDKVHNGESPEQVINTFDLQIVNQENVEDYADIWKKWVPNG